MSVFDDVAKALESLSREFPITFKRDWPTVKRGDNLYLHEFRDKPDNQILVTDAGQADPARSMRGISFLYPRVSIIVRHVEDRAAESTCDGIYRNILDCWLGRAYGKFKHIESAPSRLKPDKEKRCMWAFTLRLEVHP